MFRTTRLLVVCGVLLAVGCTKQEEPSAPSAPPVPSADLSRLEVSAGVIQAGSEEVSVTLKALDARGQPVANARAEFRSSGTGNQFRVPSTRTNNLGQVTAVFTTTKAEVKTLSAVVEGVEITEKREVVAKHAAPAPWRSTAESNVDPAARLIADGVDTAGVSCRVLDAYDNPVTNAEVRLAMTGTGNVLGQEVQHTDDDGRATFLVASTRAEVKYVTLTLADGQRVGAGIDLQFRAGPLDPAHSSLEFPGGRVAAADGVDYLFGSAHLEDAFGNLIHGVEVDVQPAEGGRPFEPFTVWAETGRAIFKFHDTQPGTYRIRVTVEGVALGGPEELSFVLVPVIGRSTLGVQGDHAVADGAAEVIAIATVRDALDRPVPGTEIRFGQAGAGRRWTSPTILLTDAEGVASARLTATRAGAGVVTALLLHYGEDGLPTGGMLGDGALATFEAGALVADGWSLRLSHRLMVADGRHPVQVTATTTDARGNPLAGVEVAFAATGDGNLWPGGTSARSDANGTATVMMATSSSGPRTVSASVGELALGSRRLDFVTPGTGLRITEVGSTYYANVAAWFEVWNSTSDPIDLASYTLRSTALQGYTNVEGTFTLPSLVIGPGEYAVILGGTPDARPGARVVAVKNAAGMIPFWSASGNRGHIELLRDGATVDFVTFNGDTAPPTTAGSWTGGPAPTLASDVNGYGRSLSRDLQGTDTGTAADWKLVEFSTAGGPNDVVPGAVATDGDGIPDSAKLPGGTFAGLDLHAMGARGGQRDIFVEVDAMEQVGSDAAPNVQHEALELVKRVFARHGFALHFDAGDRFGATFGPGAANLGQTDRTSSRSNCVTFNASPPCADLYTLKAGNQDIARRSTFHYALFGTSQRSDGGCGSGGIGELLGNDLIVTMGGCGYVDDAWARDQLINVQAAVLMHELGHNLNLRHGGGDDVNFKPNYLSIMNYLYSYVGVPDPNAADAGLRYALYRGWRKDSTCTIAGTSCGPPEEFRLDYSTNPGLPLEERAIIEASGLMRPGATAVDFNNSASIDPSAYSADLNGDFAYSSLSDFDDWKSLVLSFRRSNQWVNAPPAGEEGTEKPRAYDPVASDRQAVADETGFTIRPVY